ncbi:DEKNAAC102571 [Brettanomyces naardenensis]|uniref:DEKNAAC102571 n=1 Tax=Brettanomyces naardenensis TaxID=13370 RepID=A0A448YKH1_BRENA|nr:DEKNAAC102571 [Brettanomyces naardenensis]
MLDDSVGPSSGGEAGLQSPDVTIKSITDMDEEAHIGTPLLAEKTRTVQESVAKIKHSLASSVSGVFSFLFLIILTQLALLSYFFTIYIRRVHKYSPSSQRAYPIEHPHRRLDLQYYVELLGLELYQYKLTTKDGFVIVMNRIVNTHVSHQGKKPILLIHGLLQSSGSFISGGYKSLAYLLIQNGYDVWLGNNRCGFHPQHVEYNDFDPKMWDWDLTEMCKFDLTCMIDQILKITQYQGKISLLGHSQGTAEITMLLAREYHIGYEDKIDKCVLLAPAVYGGPTLNEKLFIKFMRYLPSQMFDIFFGVYSFIPLMMTMRRMMYSSDVYGLSSYAMFSYLFDSNDYHWDRQLRDIHFLFAPVYQSSKLMKWWLQGQGFRQGLPILKTDEPWFNDSTPELLLVVGGKDRLVDGNMFYDHIMAKEESMREKVRRLLIPDYNHLDVLWADSVQETVGKEMLTFLRGIE